MMPQTTDRFGSAPRRRGRLGWRKSFAAADSGVAGAGTARERIERDNDSGGGRSM
jgi:hypothetical protein